MNTPILIKIIAIIFCAICLSCGHRYPANVTEEGEWKHLNELEYKSWYFRAGDKIYGVDLGPIMTTEYHRYKPMNGVDANSFQVNSESEYAKDKKNVYYPLNIECYDGDSTGGCEIIEYVIKGADPNTFKYLGDGYGVDRRHMYFEGIRIPWDNVIFDKSKRYEKAKTQYLYIYGDGKPFAQVDTIPY